MSKFELAVTGNTLLAYSIGTEPDPLQVSPPSGTTQLGTLTIVVSNPTTTQYVYVQSITFSFPEGTGAQALTNVDTGMVTAASPSGTWNFAQTGVGTFKATPASGSYVQMGTNGAVFEISGIVINTTVGNVTLSIVESSSYSTSGFASTNGSGVVPKFPYGFFFSNLTPSAPAVNDGGTVTLTWEGSDGPTYTMLYPGGQADVTEVRAWTSPPLHTVTTFLLQAVSQQQGQSVTTSLSTTVIVNNGQISLTALTVTTDVTMVGAPQTLTPPTSTGGAKATSSFTAPTDGLVIGYIGANQSGDATQQSIGWISIQNSTGAFVVATGGNFINYAQQNPPPAPELQFAFSSNNQSISLPVRNGETFSISLQNMQYNAVQPQVNFWYIPFGSGSASVAAAQARAEVVEGFVAKYATEIVTV